jgi:hypothetical protein
MRLALAPKALNEHEFRFTSRADIVDCGSQTCGDLDPSFERMQDEYEFIFISIFAIRFSLASVKRLDR